MTAVFVAIGTVVYLQAGFQLGRRGWDIWKGMRHSTEAMFYFPVHWARGIIGRTASVPILDGINPPEGAYRTAMIFFWPFSLFWSAVIVTLFLGPDLLLTHAKDRLARKPLSLAELDASLEAQGREVDDLIWKLEYEAQESRERARIAAVEHEKLLAAPAEDAEEENDAASARRMG